MGLQPNPQALEWAIERSGVSREAVIKEWPKFEQWLDGTWSPTVKQIRDFADKVHVSIPALFSDGLPDLGLQIADFRTTDDAKVGCPSPELYDTIGAMMARQEWMRSYFLHERYNPIAFVGSYSTKPITKETKDNLIEELHKLLQLDEDWACREKTAASALRYLKDSIERAGIAVVVNGVVNDNPHRPLNHEEFRGFVLSDKYAPLIFINGKDKKTAQIFTLMHEMCHLAFSQTGVSNPLDDKSVDSDMERFCNRVAEDFLVPTSSFFREWDNASRTEYQRIERVAKNHKVNFMVAARKAEDEGVINAGKKFELWNKYRATVPTEQVSSSGGGNRCKNCRC